MRIFNSLTDLELVTTILNGGVGILPTDTLYGLVARAASPNAVERMYALKRRNEKPGTTIAATPEQLIDLGVDADVVTRVAKHWPAPLSIVLPLDESLTHLHQGLGESPFRVIADENLHLLLQKTGPLVTSSANQPGEPPARSISEAQAYFGDQVDFYVDGGDIGDREPSTIARLTGEKLEVLRQGAAHIASKDTKQ
jgi:tRNA threonylcarbamoyl adenosine modification protein (Sua5/YciO/YrdC/YwlC family)